MWIQNFIKSLTSISTRRCATRQPAPRLCLEALEDRFVPAFLAPVNYPVAVGGVSNIVTADFNGDGPLDLVSSAYILLGNGDGTFQTARTWRADGNSYLDTLAVADFNGDGKPDLATDGSVYLGNGDGTFGSARMISPYFYLMEGAIAAGDMNADGKVDLVGVAAFWDNSDATSGSVAVCLGIGDGTFADPWYEARPNVQPNSVALADFNGDGKLDVTLGEPGILLGNGDGTLSGGWWGQARSIGVADFNGDGKLDQTGDTTILLGNGDGTFQLGGSYAVGSSDLALADFNGDGITDMANTWSGVEIFLGNGDGTMRTPPTQPDSHAGDDLVSGDFNGDGFADLVMNHGVSAFSVLINDGNWPPLDAPTVSIGDATVSEGNAGTRTANFTVNLSAAYVQTVMVVYATANGTAAAGSDYQAKSGTLTFAPGETTKTIPVLIKGDRVGEPNETFTVNLSAATNANIVDGQGIGTIVDDEPHIIISDVTKVEGRKGKTTLFTFTVTLSAVYDQPVTMSFKTTDGTAKTGDNDYVAKSGTLTFAPGQTTKTITIEVKGDSKKESDEYFYVDLYGLSSNALFTGNRGLGRIWNDD